jgi:hypothetical protein
MFSRWNILAKPMALLAGLLDRPVVHPWLGESDTKCSTLNTFVGQKDGSPFEAHVRDRKGANVAGSSCADGRRVALSPLAHPLPVHMTDGISSVLQRSR